MSRAPEKIGRCAYETGVLEDRSIAPPVRARIVEKQKQEEEVSALFAPPVWPAKGVLRGHASFRKV